MLRRWRAIEVTLKWSSAPAVLTCPAAFSYLPAGIWLLQRTGLRGKDVLASKASEPRKYRRGRGKTVEDQKILGSCIIGAKMNPSQNLDILFLFQQHDKEAAQMGRLEQLFSVCSDGHFGGSETLSEDHKVKTIFISWYFFFTEFLLQVCTLEFPKAERCDILIN